MFLRLCFHEVRGFSNQLSAHLHYQPNVKEDSIQ